jgi:pimeloyl-[acyl-carrier protein] methyl ester esterase
MSPSSSLELVFVHGWGLDSRCWLPFLKKLPTNWSCKALDLPGYGEQRANTTTWQLKEIAQWVNKQLSHPCVLVGWSMGGLIATYAASQHPQKIKGLITIGTNPKFVQTDDWQGVDVTIFKQFQLLLKLEIPQLIERFIAIQAIGHPRAKTDIAALKTLMCQPPYPDKGSLKAGLDVLEHSDLRDCLANLAIPSLHIFGKQDRLTPKTSMQKGNRQFVAQHRFCGIADATHAPFISHPQSCITEIQQYIKQLGH